MVMWSLFYQVCQVSRKTRRKPYTKVVLEISLRIRILVAAYVSAVWSAQHRHISLFTNCMKHASIIDWFMSDLVALYRATWFH